MQGLGCEGEVGEGAVAGADKAEEVVWLVAWGLGGLECTQGQGASKRLSIGEVGIYYIGERTNNDVAETFFKLAESGAACFCDVVTSRKSVSSVGRAAVKEVLLRSARAHMLEKSIEWCIVLSCLIMADCCC